MARAGYEKAVVRGFWALIRKGVGRGGIR
jgi:hypothetical protein